MMTTRREDIARLLRRRILTGLRAGTLQPGDRLASTRDLAARLGIDPRVALAAYRQLATEALVELRPRSGIYVAAGVGDLGPTAAGNESWLVEVLVQAVGREIPVLPFAEWLQRAVSTRRLRAVLVAPTLDEVDGIAFELENDYALDVFRLHGRGEDALPNLGDQLLRADLVVTTAGSRDWVKPHAERAGLPLVLANVRPDLVGQEWRRALQQPLFVVMSDPAFEPWVRELIGDEDASNLRFVVIDRDDISVIPDDAPVYVTKSARSRLRERSVPGRLMAPARVLAPDASRALLELIVRANLEAADTDKVPPAASENGS